MQSKQPIASALQNELHMFVLDVLRHDTVEQVASIVRLLNDASGCIGWREFWRHDVSPSEVLSALAALERDGDVAAWHEGSEEDNLVRVSPGRLDSSACGNVWFGLTENGRRRLEKWEPPVS